MKNILKKIDALVSTINRPIVLMELCGTHTEAVAKYGIKKMLPKNIKLLSGPGCPVCVTDQRDINAVIVLALEGIPIACYGDVLRVPGTIQMKNENIKTKNDNANLKNNINCHCKKTGMATKQPQNFVVNLSLDKAREIGADITEVYSTEDALKIQKKKPNLVFFGLGFETTAPMTASAIKRGLTVYSSHKSFVPAMQAIIGAPTLKIDGFINPGHVSTIIGIEPYKKFKVQSMPSKAVGGSKFKVANQNLKLFNSAIPQVIAGFEAEDVLLAIYMLLKQIAENRAEVENEYTRAVRPKGNLKAMKLINKVFEIKDAYWRGLGKIPNSGFEIRSKYSQFDAKVKYKKILNFQNSKFKIQNSSPGCICGAILRGLKEPKDCKLFNKKCAPENPVGACMVSREGACGIEARYKN